MIVSVEEFEENIEALDEWLEEAKIGRKHRDRIVDAYLVRMTGNKTLVRLFRWLREKPYRED